LIKGKINIFQGMEITVVFFDIFKFNHLDTLLVFYC
jgi:hypothetical protein